MADIKFIITADEKGAVRDIKKVETAIGGMRKQAEKGTPALGGMFKKLALGVGSVVAAGMAFRNLTRFMKDAVDRAAEQELAEKNLVVALQSTGREVPALAEHFKEYAKQIQSATVFGDEQILSAQALLIQLTKLDKEGLDAATKGAVGLASVFGQDLNAATNLVAKALAGNYGALSRYGISVTHLNTDEEKRGDLLRQLNVLYERAKGEVDTYSGAVKQLGNYWGDAKEEIGKAITENEDLRRMIQDLTAEIKRLIDEGKIAEWVEKAVKGFKRMVTDIKNVVEAIVDVFEFIGRGIEEFVKKAKIQFLELKLGWLRVKGIFSDVGEEIQLTELELAKLIRGVEGHDRKLKEVTTTTDSYKEKIIETTSAVQKMTEEVDTQVPAVKGVVAQWNWWKTTIENISTVLKNAKDDFDNFVYTEAIPPTRDLSDAWGQAVDEMTTYTFEFQDATKKKIKDDSDSVQNIWNEIADGIRTKWTNEISSMLQGTKSLKDGLKGIWDAIKMEFFDLVAQMVAKWLLGFVGKILEGGKGLFDGVSSVFKGIGSFLTGSDSGSGSGGLFGGLASSFLGSAASIAGPLGIGLLAAKFLDFKKIGQSVSDVISKALGAVGDVIKGVGNIFKSIFGAGSNIIAGIGQAIGGLGGILGKLGSILKSGGKKYGEITHWLSLLREINQIAQNYIKELAIDNEYIIKVLEKTMDAQFVTRDKLFNILHWTKKVEKWSKETAYNTGQIAKNIKGAQSGMDQLITRPTLIAAHPGEYVHIAPATKTKEIIRTTERISTVPAPSQPVIIKMFLGARQIAEGIFPALEELKRLGRHTQDVQTLVKVEV